MSTTGQLQSSGVMIAVNVFIDPNDVEKYLALASDCAKRFLAEPECNFCEFLQSEEHPGNLRIVHGWTKSKEWYYEVRHAFHSSKSSSPNDSHAYAQTHAKQEWFQIFQEEVEKLFVKPRMIQYFNRVPWKGA